VEKSKLFSEYVYLLVPLTFFLLFYSILDNFNKLLYNAVFGTFLNDFLQRLIILSIVLFFIAGWLNLNQLIIFYAVAVSAKGAIIFFYLLVRGEVNLKPQLAFVNQKLKREMINVSIFSILAGIGGSVVFSFDKIIVNQMLGLSATGVYTIAFFFGTLVVIPSRPMLRISGTLIADAWKRNDVKYITDVYAKSCLNQFVIAAFLFGGIWVNIDNILEILGPDYATGKWVILFIGLGYLIDMTTGANNLVIAYSKHYRIALWFLVVLIVLVLTSMYLFIPLWGITGAAIAIALSFLANNFMRFIFLYRKFKMQPFTSRFLIIVVAFFAAYFLGFIIPQQQLIADILFRGTVFALVYLSIVIGFRVSDDINSTLQNFLKKYKIIKP
jgi:O-antigen/teichoic acid export membrane protein